MKLKVFLTIPLLAGILVGCGDDEAVHEEVVTNPAPADETNTTANETPADESSATGTQTVGEQQTAEALNFTNFDLDVEYANDVSYNAEYENDNSGISADLEDEINKVNLSGDEAYTQLLPILESLTFDETFEDQDVIDQVLKAFELEDNYNEFELEVKFLNGEAKNYKVQK